MTYTFWFFTTFRLALTSIATLTESFYKLNRAGFILALFVLKYVRIDLYVLGLENDHGRC